MRKIKAVATVVLVCMLIIVVFTAGCTANKAADAPDSGGQYPVAGGVMRYPLLDDPVSLDPAQFNEELSIAVGKEIFDGLVDIDYRTNKVVPAHAEKWDIRDNIVFTFYLRRGTRFHNGKEVTAEDFRYSLDRLLNPQTGSTVGWLLADVRGAALRMAGKAASTEGIKVVDKYTLQITLVKPNPAFLSLLANPGAAVVDRETVERATAGRKGINFAPIGSGPDVVVGSGPFRLAKWMPKNLIKLVRNENYYGRRALLDSVEFRIIPDETTTLNEFRAGNLDYVNRIPPGQVGLVEQEFRDQVIKSRSWQVVLLAFNLNKAPFKGNVRLRQALNYAIDREGIIKAVLDGMGTPAKGVIPPGMPEYNEDLDGYRYDPARAADLLAQAGYPKGQGLPEIGLYFNTRETNQKIAEAVQAQLKEIGVKVRLYGLPLPEYKREVFNGNFDMFRLAWFIDSLDAGGLLYPLFAIGGNGNLNGYSNKEINRLLDKASRSVLEQERIELYRQAEQLIVHDAPAIMLYHPLDLGLKGQNIRGLKVNPNGTVPLNEIWISR